MKILPLRLHVDHDALDFLKKFFSFKDPDALPSQPSDPADETFFRTSLTDIAQSSITHYLRTEQAEVFPVDLKLDYIEMNDPDTFDVLPDGTLRSAWEAGENGERRPVILSGAMWVGKTRLIDNIILGDESKILS